MFRLYFTVFCLSYLVSTLACAAGNNDTKLTQPPTVGNFILLSSQQPGPLLGLGENILDKGQWQTAMFMDDYSGPGVRAMDIIPGVLYGITDALSIFFNMPVAVDYKQPGQHSSGLEDAYVQLEYAYYTKNTHSYEDQATIVANISFPTGSSGVRPPTGNGAVSYTLGTTFNRTWADWFVFTAPGIVLNSVHNGNRAGDQFFYQFGLGKNLRNIGRSWLIAGLAELTGSLVEANHIATTGRDGNTGGNTVLLTPSVWIADKNIIFQFGVGVPVVQNLHGQQTKIKYVLAGNFSWTFI
jgi:hypothetical protein